MTLRSSMTPRARKRAGFTVLELLLAMALMSLLVLALVNLLNTSLTIWGRTERNRDIQETAGAVLDLFAEDLQSLEPGPRGDLVGEWAAFDTDRDGLATALYPRLRFVKQATSADLLRRSLAAQESRESRTEEDDAARVFDPRQKTLVEVCWALLPSKGTSGAREAGRFARDTRPQAVLWRGERALQDDSISFFDEDFFTSTNQPAPGSLEYVTGGVLWCEVAYARKTSILHGGWKLGSEFKDCAASWDAHGLGRPSGEASELNEHASRKRKPLQRAGRVDPADTAEQLARAPAPELPRRVRVTLEIERPRELKFRTRLTALLEPDGVELRVGDVERVPAVGGLLLIGEEWMEVFTVGRDSITVRRGRRGSRPAVHEAGALIHHGARLVREFPVSVMWEDWDL